MFLDGSRSDTLCNKNLLVDRTCIKRDKLLATALYNRYCYIHFRSTARSWLFGGQSRQWKKIYTLTVFRLFGLGILSSVYNIDSLLWHTPTHFNVNLPFVRIPLSNATTILICPATVSTALTRSASSIPTRFMVSGTFIKATESARLLVSVDCERRRLTCDCGPIYRRLEMGQTCRPSPAECVCNPRFVAEELVDAPDTRRTWI
jgi:hypothetical protein